MSPLALSAGRAYNIRRRTKTMLFGLCRISAAVFELEELLDAVSTGGVILVLSPAVTSSSGSNSDR
jgi:hypothetical protein